MRNRSAVMLAAVMVLAVVTFGRAIGSAYQLDDIYRIVQNPELDHVWPPWRHFLDPSTSASLPTIVQFRPMLPLSLSVGHWLNDLFGLRHVVGDHASNLLLHAVASGLVFALLRRLATVGDHRRPGEVAGFGAALYAVHPIAGIPVNYACARDLLLMQVFWLGAFVIYLDFRTRKGGWRLAAGAALLGLSLLSKTNPVMAPLVVLCAEVWLLPRDRIRWLGPSALAVVVGGFFLYSRLGLGFSDAGQLLVDRPWVEYPRAQLALHLGHYLPNFVWPFSMHPLPDPPARTWADPMVWGGGALVAGSLGIAWRVRARQPLISFGIVAYWLAFAPTSSVLPFRMLAADYRMVPALPFLGLLVALGGLQLPHGRTALGLLVVYLAGAALLTTPVWHTSETLWGHAVRHGTTSQGHMNYAFAVQARAPDLARRHYRIALERNSNNAFAHVNLGLLEIRQGQVVDGVESLRRAVTLAPTWPVITTWAQRGCEEARSRLPSAAKEQRRWCGYE